MYPLRLVILIGIIAIVIYSFMQQKQAGRREKSRQRLEDKEDELIKMLRKNKSDKENLNENES